MKKIVFLLFFLGVSFSSFANRSVFVEYDRGEKNKIRNFVSAENCLGIPCIITQWGAIKLPEGIEKTYRVQLGSLHRGSFHPITFFQESTTFEQKLSERIFNRKPNRKVIDLESLVENEKSPIIYMYGVLLQHELDESDPLVLTLLPLKGSSRIKEFYFRYHHEGAKFDVDIAFVQPLNVFHPNPGDVIQAAHSTVALSFSVARSMDPEKQYSLFGKITRAVRFNLIAGLLLRKDVAPLSVGDNITKESFDTFAGGGLTFFDFLAVGYGANLIRSPHTSFPFVGIEIRHLLEFLRSFKADTHTRWQKYLKEETERSSVSTPVP